ncbi:ribonuclease H-like domain-containing protein [Tanacetum coccineum]
MAQPHTEPPTIPQPNLPSSIAQPYNRGPPLPAQLQLPLSAHQNSPLPPLNFDLSNPNFNTNPVNEPHRTHPMIIRSQLGIIKPIDRLSLNTFSISPISKNLSYALQDPHWRNAIYDEYNALVKNGTWLLVPRPACVNMVHSIWLFKHKFHADGTLSHHKASLVANGSSQQLGVDFDKTFSPVVKLATICTVLSLVVSQQWPIHQLDVKNAFLKGDLSKTVYMHQPPIFVDSQYPHHVCLLQRSLYGLKQAPRAWFQWFAGYATWADFYHSRCDSSLFIYRHGSQVAYLLIYVDDIILTASSLNLLQHIIASLHNEFDMTDLGAFNYFLGISVDRTSTGLFLSQKKYALQLLELAHMVNCNPSQTPVDTKSKLGLEGIPVQDPTLYRSLAGGLRYLTFTRLDLSYAVQHICLYMHDLQEPHFAAPKRILRYVWGTVDFGLQLYISATTSLHTLSCFSVKAEYRGVANVVAEIAWLRNLLCELHSPLSTTTLVYCDNVSAFYMSANPVQHQQMKHIEIDIHFVCDMVTTDIILDDVYDTFYKDEEEEAKVAKESGDMELFIMKESEKPTVKDYTELVMTDGMVDYVLEKYENNWKCENEIAFVILEDLWLEVDLARAIKAKQVDDHDDDLDTLVLENKIKKLEEDFGRLLKAKKAKEARKAKEVELKAKEAMLAKLKAKEAMLAEVAQISSDKDDPSDEDPTASTFTRSRAPIATTSNSQAASTALIGCKKISMT